MGFLLCGFIFQNNSNNRLYWQYNKVNGLHVIVVNCVSTYCYNIHNEARLSNQVLMVWNLWRFNGVSFSLICVRKGFNKIVVDIRNSLYIQYNSLSEIFVSFHCFYWVQIQIIRRLWDYAKLNKNLGAEWKATTVELCKNIKLKLPFFYVKSSKTHTSTVFHTQPPSGT